MLLSRISIVVWERSVTPDVWRRLMTGGYSKYDDDFFLYKSADDPAVVEVEAILQTAGLKRSGENSPTDESTYGYREYTVPWMPPIEEAEYLVLIGTLGGTMEDKHARGLPCLSRDYRLIIQLERYQQVHGLPAYYGAVNMPLVDDALRAELKEQHFEHLVFHETVLWPREWIKGQGISQWGGRGPLSTDHPNGWDQHPELPRLWQCDSDLELPPMHPKTKFEEGTPNHPNIFVRWFAVGDSDPFHPGVPHYRRKDIEAVEPFDIARTHEPMRFYILDDPEQAKTARMIIISKRFYNAVKHFIDSPGQVQPVILHDD